MRIRLPKGRIGICHYCGLPKKVKRSTKSDEDICAKCYSEHEAPRAECIHCHKMEPIHRHTNKGPECKICARDVDKKLFGRCSICGKKKQIVNKKHHACGTCYDRELRPRAICVKCGRLQIVKKHDPEGRPIGKPCEDYKRKHGHYPGEG